MIKIIKSLLFFAGLFFLLGASECDLNKVRTQPVEETGCY